MNLRLTARAVVVVIASQTLAGCFFLWDRDEPTPLPYLVPPEQEAATFRFTASRGCAALLGGGCTPERPLLAGVRESVRVDLLRNPGGGDPTVSSSDPSVVSVGAVRGRSTDGGGYVGSFEVRAGARGGAAELTVTQADGATAAVTIRVAEAAGMDLVEDEGTARYDRAEGSIALRVGERVSMNAYPVSIDGERLYANDGVTWSVPSPQRVNLSWSTMSGPRVDDDHVYVEGRAPGVEVLTVRAGVVERTLIVEVR
jgi:hypothetical protein